MKMKILYTTILCHSKNHHCYQGKKGSVMVGQPLLLLLLLYSYHKHLDNIQKYYILSQQ